VLAPLKPGGLQQHGLPPVVFPISPDHHLITLVQYNVLRAMMTNFKLLSLLHTLPDVCGNYFYDSFVSVTTTAIPPALQPTPMQQVVPHPPWVDIVPDAALRDNLIVHQKDIDVNELCSDLVGGLYEGYDDVALRGILVWRDPWREDAWEVTEGFAKKWAFLLKGCQMLVSATNAWRQSRGEEALVVEL
jgi:hypothetical protein